MPQLSSLPLLTLSTLLAGAAACSSSASDAPVQQVGATVAGPPAMAGEPSPPAMVGDPVAMAGNPVAGDPAAAGVVVAEGEPPAADAVMLGGDAPGVGGVALPSASMPAEPLISEPNEAILVEEPSTEEMEPEACAGISLETETLTVVPPVTLYLVLDNSKSMREDPIDGVTKWEQAVDAFTQFVRAPESEGIGLGIQYFHPSVVEEAQPEVLALQAELERQTMLTPPDERPPRCLTDEQGNRVCNDGYVRFRADKCDGGVHARSATEFGRLPLVADAVVESLNSIVPDSNTPTVGALRGGVDFCANFMQQNPEEQCVVVFVTDGQPNGCGLDLTCHEGFTPNKRGDCVDPEAEGVLSPIVQEAHDAQGVLTYTVGMEGVVDDGFDLLDTLAVLGGTDCTPDVPGDEACNVTESGTEGLLAALSKIRDAVVVTIEVPCAWDVPEPPDGKLLDPDLVNVSLRVREGEPEQPLGRVPSQADCAAVLDGGWYYDDAMNPTQVHACPQSCGVVEEHAATIRVNLEFGCATRKAIIQ